MGVLFSIFAAAEEQVVDACLKRGWARAATTPIRSLAPNPFMPGGPHIEKLSYGAAPEEETRPFPIEDYPNLYLDKSDPSRFFPIVLGRDASAEEEKLLRRPVAIPDEEHYQGIGQLPASLVEGLLTCEIPELQYIVEFFRQHRKLAIFYLWEA